MVNNQISFIYLMYKGYSFCNAYLKELWAKFLMDCEEAISE